MKYTTTVRLRKKAWEKLDEIASATGRTKRELLEEAVDWLWEKRRRGEVPGRLFDEEEKDV